MYNSLNNIKKLEDLQPLINYKDNLKIINRPNKIDDLKKAYDKNRNDTLWDDIFTKSDIAHEKKLNYEKFI